MEIALNEELIKKNEEIKDLQKQQKEAKPQLEKEPVKTRKGEIDDGSIPLINSTDIIKKRQERNSIRSRIQRINKTKEVKIPAGARNNIGTGDVNGDGVLNVLDVIFDEDSIHKSSDQTKKELTEFVDSLNSEQFEKLANWFQNMPAISYNLESLNVLPCVENPENTWLRSFLPGVFLSL